VRFPPLDYVLAQTDRGIGGSGASLSFEREIPALTVPNAMFGQPHGFGPNQDLSGIRSRLNAGGSVDGVARHGDILPARGIPGAGYYLSCVDADSNTRLDPPLHPGACHNGLDCFLHAQATEYSPLGIILMGDGSPEQREHRIARILLDRAPIPLDLTAHSLEVFRLDVAKLLGIESLRERSEAHQVAEQGRDQAALLGLILDRRDSSTGMGRNAWRSGG
jgi:hypothetical protein